MFAKSDLPRISVVTVALNAANDLPLTIESVIAQDYAGLEYVVIDGESWDDTAKVLARYTSEIDRVIVRGDAGIYAAMNDAVDDVTGDYVIFLNAGDQFFGADAVSRIARGLQGKPDVFYGNHVYVNRRDELYKRAASFDWLAARLRDGKIDHVWHSSVPGHQATFTSVPLLRRMRYDTRLKVSADHEFLFRAYASGAEMQYIDETVAHYHGGGFSAAVGELTKTEGVSVYRRYSDNPSLVDSFFYARATPFVPQTQRTGFKLTGFISPHALPDVPAVDGDVDWIAAGGCEIMSPSDESTGLSISGSNLLADQMLSIILDGYKIGSAAIPCAKFRVEIPFLADVPANSIVRLTASRTLELKIDDVSIALESFRFLTANTYRSRQLCPGESLKFNAGSSAAFADTLGSGWSYPEDAYIWSIGPRSNLCLALDAAAQNISIDISGNPHVEQARQLVNLIVNGEAAAELLFNHGERKTFKMPVNMPPWRRHGINRIELLLDKYGAPPVVHGDERELGVCLWSVTVR